MEFWKPVLGYEAIYEVSRDGNVRSVRTGAIRQPAKTYKGYLTLQVSKSGVFRTKSVHVLVAEAFLGPRPTAKAQVNHMNGIKTDNRLDNLEWVSPSENIKHRYKLFGSPVRLPSNVKRATYMPPQKGEGNYNARLTEERALEIITLFKQGRSIKSVAREFGISKTLASYIRSGARWPHLPR